MFNTKRSVEKGVGPDHSKHEIKVEPINKDINLSEIEGKIEGNNRKSFDELLNKMIENDNKEEKQIINHKPIIVNNNNSNNNINLKTENKELEENKKNNS